MDTTAWPVHGAPLPAAAAVAGSECDEDEVMASGTVERVPSVQMAEAEAEQDPTQQQQLTTPSLAARLEQLMQTTDVVVEIGPDSGLRAQLREHSGRAEQAAVESRNVQTEQATVESRVGQAELAALAELCASAAWKQSAGRLRNVARGWAAAAARTGALVEAGDIAMVARMAGSRSPAGLARWLAGEGLGLRVAGGRWRVDAAGGAGEHLLAEHAAVAAAVPALAASMPAEEDASVKAEGGMDVDIDASTTASASASTSASTTATATADATADATTTATATAISSSGRPSRRTRRVTNYDERALAAAADIDVDIDAAPAKRARRSAAPRPAKPDAGSTADVLSSERMLHVLEQAGAAVCVPADRAPDLAQLLRPDMPPLLVPRSLTLPPHVVGRRAAYSEAQQVTDCMADDFPLPVVLRRWVVLQQRKYAAYVAAAECQVVNVVGAPRDATCQRYRSAVNLCKNCQSRQADQPCIFRGVTMLTTLTLRLFDGSVLERMLAAPILAEPPIDGYAGFDDECARQPGPERFFPPAAAAAAASPAAWHASFCALAVAPLLAPLLAHAAALLEPTVHVRGVEYTAMPAFGCSSAPCVRRPLADGSRELCDACSGEMFAVYFMCCVCARELCAACFARLDDAPVRTCRYMAKDADRLLLCRQVKRLGSLARLAHRRDQFVRVSRLAPLSVARALGVSRAAQEAARVLGPVDCVGIVEPAVADEFARRKAALQARTRALYAYEAWEEPPVCVEAGELSLEEFSRLWRAGTVVVVRGLLDRLDADVWTPDWWTQHRGSEPVTILDCASRAEPISPPPDGLSWTIADFFRWFDEGVDSDDDIAAAEPGRARQLRRHVRKGILKLKDYPPTEDFAAKLPRHFACFMRALPFPEYTHRGGALNLASRLPSACLPPDLGPKMYCAYGSTDAKGGYGTTNLHCDMADAVNLMCYATGNRPDQPAAVWDLFPSECMAALREYMTAEVPSSAQRPEDPVHDQGSFLTAEHRAAFCERNPGVRIFRVYQNPGDAVFVPAGFGHQVCNYANAVKVAVDFVSPERVQHCDRLAKEFRQLSAQHPRSNDKLQLDNMMFWTLAADPASDIVLPGELDSGGDGNNDQADGSANGSDTNKDSSAARRARAERKERRDRRESKQAATPKQPRRYNRKAGSRSPDDPPSPSTSNLSQQN